MSAGDHWIWRRWQLVLVEESDDGLTVDAIELPDEALDEAGSLITLLFRAVSGPGDCAGVRRRLERWVDRDDGVCDAFHRSSSPFGSLALFQGNDSLIVTSASVA